MAILPLHPDQGNNLFAWQLVPPEKRPVCKWTFIGGGGVSAQNVSTLYGARGPQCPLLHLNNRNYSTALLPPGSDWLCDIEIFILFILHYWNVS